MKQDARVETAIGWVTDLLAEALPGVAGDVVKTLGPRVVDKVLDALGIDTGSVAIHVPPAGVKVSIKSKKRRK